MVKTEASIKLYWEKKKELMRKKADFKYANLINRRRKVVDRKFEYEIEKYERKKKAYIKKKEEEYRRKCLNAIRELKNKPKRVYKSEWPKIVPLQFAMKMAQESAKLRDTDENGRGRCISCNRLFEWEWLAGWHRYSPQNNWTLAKDTRHSERQSILFERGRTKYKRQKERQKRRTETHPEEGVVKEDKFPNSR